MIVSTTLVAQELTDKQRELANRYAQLEQILFRLAETSLPDTAGSDRTALLKKAILESKDKLLVRRLETLVNTLEKRQLTDAVNEQTVVEQDLIQLLKLLESENRNERRDKEKEQIKEFIKNLEELLHSERTLKNQTQQSELPNLPMLENQQQDIRLQTQTLEERLAEHEGKSSPSESSPEQQQQSSDQQTPSQQALRQALERMKQAEQKLNQADKENALEEQEEAIAELQRAKEELEKILRQIREEELMQTLEKLEERFQRMLQQERTLRTQTEQLIAEEKSQTDQRQIKIRSDRLSGDQQSVIEDAESALLVLREDGTAQAMVESLLQARFDMTEVKKRLDQTLLDAATVHIEESVIDSLQEMLMAVQEAKEKVKEWQEQADGQPSAGGTLMEEPLIQVLAELRMIRSMQRRVNERTKRYDDEIQQLLEKPETEWEILKKSVEELARQQNRISRILYELEIGKTD